MVTLTTSLITNLSDDVARQIAERLTNPNSAMQQELWDVVAYRTGRMHPRSIPYTYIAYFSQSEEQTGDMEVIGWSASRLWRGEQTFECFVDPEHRRMGIAAACLSALLADRRVLINQPVAVFSEPAERLVIEKFHWPVVHRYFHDGHDWKRSTGEIVRVPSDTYAH